LVQMCAVLTTRDCDCAAVGHRPMLPGVAQSILILIVSTMVYLAIREVAVRLAMPAPLMFGVIFATNAGRDDRRSRGV
jgi:predicted benzoate:H+ symporter BenE